MISNSISYTKGRNNDITSRRKCDVAQTPHLDFTSEVKMFPPHGIYDEESRIQVDVEEVCKCMSQSESANNSCKYCGISGCSRDEN